MKKLVVVFVLVTGGFAGNAQSPEGKEIFSTNCKACHSIGRGDIVGPDLAGIAERRDPEWIKEFILNSQKMVAAGDEQALEVFNKYNKIAMPSHNFSGEELNSLVSYMEEAGQEAKAETQASPVESGEQEIAVAETQTNGPAFFVSALLAVLVASAAILTFIATNLYRMLKS